MRNSLGAALAIACLFSTVPARADQYHYKDLLIGDRAAGLAGAYTAVSDDPSGMFYNPAGIALASDSYLSLSVNAFSSSKQTFEGIVPGQNYTYNSSSLNPSFFGFVQGMGRGKFGFMVAIPNSDQIDQNDSLSGLTTTADGGNIFQRRFFHKDITYLIGPSYARELRPNLTVGMSLPVAIRTDSVIDNQFAIFNPATPGGNRRWFFQESSRSIASYALQPKLGLLYMPAPSFAIGATLSAPLQIAGSGEFTSRTLQTSPTSLPNGYAEHDIAADQGSIRGRTPRVYKAALGIADFVSRRLMFSADFEYATGDGGFNSASVAAIPFEIRPTWNAAVGTEWYVADALALRGGVYTNRANTAKIDPARLNQPEHVDLYCGALGASYYHSGSSLSLTGNYGYGRGQGQGVGGTTSVQTVTRSTLTVMLSGSYQM